MNTEELSNRLTQILTGITSGEPNPKAILLPLSNTMPGTKTRMVLYLV